MKPFELIRAAALAVSTTAIVAGCAGAHSGNGQETVVAETTYETPTESAPAEAASDTVYATDRSAFFPRGAVPKADGCQRYSGKVSVSGGRFYCPGYQPGLIRYEQRSNNRIIFIRLIPCDSPDLVGASGKLKQARDVFCATSP